jgi:hypothetical protein
LILVSSIFVQRVFGDRLTLLVVYVVLASVGIVSVLKDTSLS